MSAGDGQPPLADTRGARERVNKRLQIQMRGSLRNRRARFRAATCICPRRHRAQRSRLARAPRQAHTGTLAKKNYVLIIPEIVATLSSGGGRVRPYTSRVARAEGSALRRRGGGETRGICRNRCTRQASSLGRSWKLTGTKRELMSYRRVSQRVASSSSPLSPSVGPPSGRSPPNRVPLRLPVPVNFCPSPHLAAS